jgi:hypothetical protein
MELSADSFDLYFGALEKYKPELSTLERCLYNLAITDFQLKLGGEKLTFKDILEHATSHKPIFRPTSSAMAMNALALSLSGSATTVGFPISASSQILACSGISPRKGMPCSSHA